MSIDMCTPELKKVGSTRSTLPERQRFSPETHKARHKLKDVWIAFQVISSVKIARFINISSPVSVAKYYDAPQERKDH